ncbi:hypothetical protein FOVSG1_000787 [Fusarium oxysporum f. sp. vasinfectum]
MDSPLVHVAAIFAWGSCRTGTGDPFRASSTNLFCSRRDDAKTIAVRKEPDPDSRPSTIRPHLLSPPTQALPQLDNSSSFKHEPNDCLRPIYKSRPGPSY